MDQEQGQEHDQDNVGVSRGQNQLHVLPDDAVAAASAIEPLLDRIESGSPATQCLVLANDPDSAAAIAARLGSLPASKALRVLAATDARRSLRALRASPAHVVVGTAETLVELSNASVLKMDALRIVALAWVDELDGSATSALETLMAELPKDSARLVLASSVTPAVELLVERYARRARRVQSAAADMQPAASLSYVATSEAGRAIALRRTLDALDPESAFVVARSESSRVVIESLLRSLGYGGPSDAVRVGETPDGSPQLVVLFDLPASDDELRRLVRERASARVIALVTPRQVASLRRLAGGAVSPFTLPDAAVRARARGDRLRDELREVLASGLYARELLALEPLIADYDGVEIAAALLRLLEAERGKPQAAIGAREQAPVTRLYLNVGTMDEVRPGDLVGAITSEAGISKAEIGKVDVRERHSTVEVSTPVANNVVSKLTGVTIRGRRVLVRVDEERPRERPKRDGERPKRDGERPDRGGQRGAPRDRGSRPPSRERPRRP